MACAKHMTADEDGPWSWGRCGSERVAAEEKVGVEEGPWCWGRFGSERLAAVTSEDGPLTCAIIGKQRFPTICKAKEAEAFLEQDKGKASEYPFRIPLAQGKDEAAYLDSILTFLEQDKINAFLEKEVQRILLELHREEPQGVLLENQMKEPQGVLLEQHKEEERPLGVLLEQHKDEEAQGVLLEQHKEEEPLGVRLEQHKDEEAQGVLEQRKDEEELQARIELYKEIRREYDPANELDDETLALVLAHDAWAKEEWAKSESRRRKYIESVEESMIDLEAYDLI